MAETIAAPAARPSGQLRAVALRLAPLLDPYRGKGRLALRIERMPERARLSRGRNNGDGSWTLTVDELNGLEYLAPPGVEAPVLSLRVIGLEQDGATLAMLSLPLDGHAPEPEPREADAAYLAKLGAELKSARAALAEREAELAQARAARPADDAVAAARAAWDAEMQQRLSAAAEDAVRAAERARASWEDGEADRLAAAQARGRENAAMRADSAAGAELARLRKQLADAQASLGQREADLATARRETAAAQERARREQIDAVADRARAGEADLARLHRQLEEAQDALAGRPADADPARLRRQLADAQAALGQRDVELAQARREAASARAERSADADFARLRRELAEAQAQLRRREDDLARIAADHAAAEEQRRRNAADELNALKQRYDAAERIAAEAMKAANERDDALAQLRDEAATLRISLLESARPSDTAQTESALLKARTAWKSEEEGRLALAEDKWRREAAAAIARATAAEAALSAKPPLVAADQATLDALHNEIVGLQRMLSEREVELAQARMTLEARRLLPDTARAHAVEKPPGAPRERRPANPANRRLLRDFAVVFVLFAVLIFAFPFVVPYLPYEWQESIADAYTSVGLAPAPHGAGAAPAAAGAAPHRDAAVVVLRDANVRKTPAAHAAVVARLKQGDSVAAGETSGNWTHVHAGAADGWVFSSYLKK